MKFLRNIVSALIGLLTRLNALPASRMPSIAGIDVSDWQPDVNWMKVKKANIAFVYAKASEGVDLACTSFSSHYAGTKSAGLVAGAYHMFDFEMDGEDQAKYFLDIYKPVGGDLPPMVDLERPVPRGARNAIASVLRFLVAVELACNGRKPIVYLNHNFWEASLGSTDAFVDCPLWLANYTSAPEPTLVPASWKKVTFWQHSQTGLVPGIPGKVDLDRFIGSRDELDKLRLP